MRIGLQRDGLLKQRNRSLHPTFFQLDGGPRKVGLEVEGVLDGVLTQSLQESRSKVQIRGRSVECHHAIVHIGILNVPTERLQQVFPKP